MPSVCSAVLSMQDRYGCPEAGHGCDKVCLESGCKESLSHLVPKLGYFDRAVDFLEKYPSVTILASGLTSVGVDLVYGEETRDLVSGALIVGVTISALLDKMRGQRMRCLLGAPVGVIALRVGKIWAASTGNFEGMLWPSVLTLATIGLATCAAFIPKIEEMKSITYVATSALIGLGLSLEP